jgi:hypothetical protein
LWWLAYYRRVNHCGQVSASRCEASLVDEHCGGLPITDVLIVVVKSVLRDVKRALEEVHPVDVRLEYFPLPEDTEGDDVGTADALRLLHDKIKVVVCFA